jgi:purine nucleosidase
VTTARPDRDSSPGEVREHWQAMVDTGDSLPGTTLAATAAQLRAAPWPEDLRDTPIIIDTDIGGDVDDALAVAAAARQQPRLALVLTGDETRAPVEAGGRARFARWLLDTLGRPDVPTVAGAVLGDTEHFCVHDLTPATVPPQPGGADAVLAAVAAVCARTDGPVRWVGMAPLSNLAHVLDHAPDLAARLRVTQMGGALAYRHPDRAEHNIRLDVDAAHRVLAAVEQGRLATPRFITSDITFTPELGITAGHPIYQALDQAAVTPAAQWAAILHAHLDRWYATAYPSTLQHDGLTLSAALGLPFVTAAGTPVVLDEIGRMSTAPDGVRLRLSTKANYPAFMTWFAVALDPATPAAASATAHGVGARRPA